MRRFQVAYCIDTRYRAHFGASVTSLLANGISDVSRLVVHVVTADVDRELEDAILSLRRARQVDIRIIPLPRTRLGSVSGLPLLSYLTEATYLRLFLPQLITGDDPILYLDADTIILKDITPLWDIAGGDFLIAGALDDDADVMAAELAVPNYINSGVILMNAGRWKATGRTEACLRFARDQAERIKYGDQCAINAMCQDGLRLLDSRWNTLVTPAATDTVVQQAAVLHYIGRFKPWHRRFPWHLANHYWRYRAASPWPVPWWQWLIHRAGI